MASLGAGRLGALGLGDGLGGDGLVSNDAGGSPFLAKARAGERRRDGIIFLWMGAKLFWLGAG